MSYEIRKSIFPARTYLIWRSEIDTANITDKNMWQSAFGQVHAYAQKNQVKVVGPGTALYFRWDAAAGKADLGIGNPVAGVSEVNEPGLSLVQVAQSPALHVLVRGDYAQLHEVHRQLTEYVEQRGLNSTLTVEEYTVMGMEKPNPQDWETNIYYLLK
jgi:effector-binding domain-containing protein